MRKCMLAAAAVLFASQTAATPPAPPPQPQPKLLVVLSIDQFSADLFDQYRLQFAGGLARLAGGVAFRNGFQSHAATETCPGHSTILTGDRPARTGIIANSWVDQSAARADKTVYCAEDERVPGSTSSAYTVSDVHLRVPTLGERMKQRWPASRNVAVSGKDRAAVMMSGHHADQRWYWSGKGFVSDLSAIPVPAVVPAVNAAVAAKIAAPEQALIPPPACTAKAAPIALPGGLTVGNGAFAREAGDATGFRASPALDGATLALAAGLVNELKLGRGPSPDILSVSLSATDYVGHVYGPGGQEMCLQLLSLDRDLSDFFAVLDKSGIDYVVALTADHGEPDIPERLTARGVKDAARLDPAVDAAKIGAAVGAKLGLKGPVLLGTIPGDVWIDRSLSEADRARAAREALALVRAQPQVYAAFAKADIAAVPLPSGDPRGWSVAQRLRASFDPERSGDLLIVLKPDIMPIAVPTKAYVASHGSPWDYDRRVPILFWRKGLGASNRDEPIETIDIMPTLAAWLGLALEPGAIDGRCVASVASCPPR